MPRKNPASASRILRTLVCEGHNTGVNAQLLSTIYISRHLKSGTPESQYLNQYTQLQRISGDHALVPWPHGDAMDDQFIRFLLDRRSGLLKEYSNFLCVYYQQKAKQFEQSVLRQKGNREKVFVRFANQLGQEIQSLPGVNLKTDFSDMMHSKKQAIEKVTNNGESGSNNFDIIFKEVFHAAAESIAQQHLMTMAAISEASIALGNAMNTYCIKKAAEQLEAPQPDCTLDELFAIKKNYSEKYTAIKEVVKKSALLKGNSRWTELLISGSTEYYRYIRDHNLDEDRIVAVINDKGLLDCDLLITDRGLVLHQGQSKASKFARNTALGAAGGLIGIAAGNLANAALELLRGEVPFADVNWNTNKDRLEKPKYANKHVDIAQLTELVKVGQKLYEGSLESEISKIIFKDNHNLFVQTKWRYSLDQLTDKQKTDLCKAIIATAIYYGYHVGDKTPRKEYAVKCIKQELLEIIELSKEDKDELQRLRYQQMQHYQIYQYLDPLPEMCLKLCFNKMDEILPDSLPLHPDEIRQKERLKAYIGHRTKATLEAPTTTTSSP